MYFLISCRGKALAVCSSELGLLNTDIQRYGMNVLGYQQQIGGSATIYIEPKNYLI